MSAGTRNKYRATWVAFCNWAVRAGADAAESARHRGESRRRRGRSPTTPGADGSRTCQACWTWLAAGRYWTPATVRRGKDKGKPICQLRPETIERLDRLGRERALIYKTLVLTGLRRKRTGNADRGTTRPRREPAFPCAGRRDEKNREGSTLPLRSDLADDLRGVARRQGTGPPGQRRTRRPGTRQRFRSTETP
jgi:hypothetical protein